MPIEITDIKFFESNFGPSDSLKYPQGNVMDVNNVEIYFSVKLNAISDSNNPFVLNNTDGYIGTGWVTCDVDVFQDFEQGDVIKWYEYPTSALKNTFTILKKLSDKEIQLDATVGANGNNFESIDSLFVSEKSVQGYRFGWNFIGPDEAPNFISPIDGSAQESIANKDASDLTGVTMANTGFKSWQYFDNVSIEGLGIVSGMNYSRNYKIIVSAPINTYLLFDQYDKNGIPPDSFSGPKCPMFVFKIAASETINNPKVITEYESPGIAGNIGWRNENYNGNAKKYTVSSVVYKNNAGTVISSLEITNVTQTAEITVTSVDAMTTGANGNYLNASWMKAPDDPAIYQNHSQYLLENFNFSTIESRIGITASSPNYGTGVRQAIKSMSSTLVSANEVKVTLTFEFGSTIITEMKSYNRKSYVLDLYIMSHGATPANSDKVTLLVDANEMFINNVDAGMVSLTSKLLRHTESDPATEGNSTLDVFPEDEIVSYSEINFDKTGRPADTILKSIEFKIKAKNSSTLSEFVLDSFKQELTGVALVSNTAGQSYQPVSVEVNRVFHIPSTEIRKKIKIKYNTSVSHLHKYYAYFPFLYRWEYWKSLAGVHGDFFNTAEPNSGFNHNWNRYENTDNWNVFYEIIVTATKEGIDYTYKDERQIASNDYNSNPDWTNESIKAYDIDTAAELYNSGSLKKLLSHKKDTKIVAMFESTTGTPNLSDTVVVLGIESYEQGGIEERRRISSKYAIGDDDSWWKSVDTSNKVKLTLVGDAVKAEALLDYTKIPANSKFKITGRIYNTAIVVPAKKMEDGTTKIMESGTTKITE